MGAVGSAGRVHSEDELFLMKTEKKNSKQELRRLAKLFDEKDDINDLSTWHTEHVILVHRAYLAAHYGFAIDRLGFRAILTESGVTKVSEEAACLVVFTPALFF